MFQVKKVRAVSPERNNISDRSPSPSSTSGSCDSLDYSRLEACHHLPHQVNGHSTDIPSETSRTGSDRYVPGQPWLMKSASSDRVDVKPEPTSPDSGSSCSGQEDSLDTVFAYGDHKSSYSATNYPVDHFYNCCQELLQDQVESSRLKDVCVTVGFHHGLSSCCQELLQDLVESSRLQDVCVTVGFHHGLSSCCQELLQDQVESSRLKDVCVTVGFHHGLSSCCQELLQDLVESSRLQDVCVTVGFHHGLSSCCQELLQDLVESSRLKDVCVTVGFHHGWSSCCQELLQDQVESSRLKDVCVTVGFHHGLSSCCQELLQDQVESSRLKDVCGFSWYKWSVDISC
ncbi:hypothetical protein Btru_010254 [Bulinus truncatus]|nr:hypothetical protein Btru_010254 [Bulinus truncatus]